MKNHPIFVSLLLIGVLSLNLPTHPAAPFDPALLNIAAVDTSETFTCALTTNGGVKCWGDNFYGQLGDGTVNDRKTPWWVSGLSDITSIAVGRFHTCALTSAGGVKCWGANNYGQLGDGSNSASHTPVNVTNLASGVTAIATGSYHTCARTTTGAMKCWGRNHAGQLGDGTITNRSEPVTIFASGINSISASWAHTCAVTTTGWAKCWGSNANGQLGDGTTTERHSPVNVSGLSGVTSSISAGGFHTCALTTTNAIKCWGRNSSGQLGDTTTAQRTEPVNVFWLASTPSAVSAGGNHTCALNTDGGVKCWGSNSFGQMGDNTTTQRTAPVDVSGLANGVDSISAGWSGNCAEMSAGGVKCWGYNGDGQLGDGTTNDRHVPVDVVSPKMTFRSAAVRDGWVLESGENTTLGGSRDAGGDVIAGDNASDRQYRAILYFNTNLLPNNAILLRVTLKIKSSGVTGIDPFTTHGNLLVDIQTGSFGAAALENADFEAAASKSNIGSLTALSGAPGWYKLVLAAADHDYINKTGATQFRLRFATDDNNDNGADYMKFFSGDYATASARPTLIIEYYVP